MERRTVGWRVDGLGLAGEFPQTPAVDVGALMVERHGHVQRVTTDDDVRGPPVEGYPVKRRVRFNEPPVLLGGQPGKEVVWWRPQPVHPG